MPAICENPREIVVPFDRNQIVRRRIVLRNASAKDLVVKMVPTAAVELERTLVRLKPFGSQQIELRAHGSKTTTFGFESIHGYAVMSYKPDIQKWAKQDSHCKKTEAFAINVSFRSDFSAPVTVIELPGTASLVTSVQTPIPEVDEFDAKTAVSITRDTITAEGFGSLTDMVNEMKAMQTSCWLAGILTSAFCDEKGQTTKPTKKSKKDSKNSSKKDSSVSRKERRAKNSSCKSDVAKNANVELQATPCGGS